ncbi:MAG: sugar ABC transporter permease [Spirochaetaceae bacterium]|jgi:multiple sugar transport system permease protein|nr:sugar ABC transporter permease [Spirochaetaceae bacterium]
MSGTRNHSGAVSLVNYVYLLPAVLFIGLFFIFSIVFTSYISFFEWDGFSSMRFVGFQNYVSIFSDPNFLLSIANTLIWVLSSLILSVLIPLLFAILITNSSFLSYFKFVFYLPNAIATTIGGIIMRSLVSTYGFPQILGMMGFKNLVFEWLATPYVNTLVMILSGVWQGVGLNMILFIVGLRSISPEPIEAAIIDGAGVFKKYRYVVFPLLDATFKVVLLMTLVNTFKVFDGIWIMTKGGPYRSSETLALTMYLESFIRNHLGLGAAVAVVLSFIILFISYFNLKKSFAPDA